MADFQSKFSGVEVETALRRLLNWVNADCTTAFNNLSNEDWSTYDNITINGNTYAAIWQVAPTAYNTVYGYGLQKETGRLYELRNDHGVYTVSDVGSDTLNTAGSSNVSSKLFLIGATTQTAEGSVTFSNTYVYTTDGKLYSNNSEVINKADNQNVGGIKTFDNYVKVKDDGNPEAGVDRPENETGMQDPDLYIYSSGFAVTGTEESDDEEEQTEPERVVKQYSFPEESGKLGLEVELVDLTEITGNESEEPEEEPGE